MKFNKTSLFGALLGFIMGIALTVIALLQYDEKLTNARDVLLSSLFRLNALIGFNLGPSLSFIILPGAYLNNIFGVKRWFEFTLFLYKFNSDENPNAPYSSLVKSFLKTSTLSVS